MPRPLRPTTPRKARLFRLTSYRSSPGGSQIPVSSDGAPPSKRTPSRILAHPRRSASLPAASPPLSARVTDNELVLTLPVPPTINHQYATVSGRRLLTADGRHYKAFVAQQVMVALSRSPSRRTLLQRFQGDSLVLSIRFHFASPLRRDVDGGLKITQDALCEALGINDNKITEIHLYKQPASSSPHIEVAVRQASSQTGLQ